LVIHGLYGLREIEQQYNFPELSSRTLGRNLAETASAPNCLQPFPFTEFAQSSFQLNLDAQTAQQHQHAKRWTCADPLPTIPSSFALALLLAAIDAPSILHVVQTALRWKIEKAISIMANLINNTSYAGLQAAVTIAVSWLSWYIWKFVLKPKLYPNEPRELQYLIPSKVPSTILHQLHF
jgi:hypothetical protein